MNDLYTELIRTDRNGTKYWHEYGIVKCGKCNGTGIVACYIPVNGGDCFDCGGSGIRHVYETWKEYTPEYEAKLNEKRLARLRAKSGERNIKWFVREGMSEDGKAWLVIKKQPTEELKANGCRWNPVLGWHYSSEHEGCLMVSIEQFGWENNVGEWNYEDESAEKIQELRNKETTKDSKSEYVGAKGEKVEVAVALKRIGKYETHYGFRNTTVWVYTSEDGDGNVLVWKTSSYPAWLDDAVAGNTYSIKGTVKGHNEYKGVKQTEIIRCKVT